MQAKNNYRITKYACYLGGGGMAATSVISPLLFVTFHDEYGISYTLLGLLVAANFLTQLSVDLIFSFFPKYFNIHKTIRAIPVIVFLGFAIYAVMPWLLPSATYLWLAIGTVVFSAAAGLAVRLGLRFDRCVLHGISRAFRYGKLADFSLDTLAYTAD